jgi:hypothetical protein
LNAANVLNNGDKHPGRNPSPRMHHGYIGHAPPTVLLSTPDSLALRPSSKESGGDYRQSSLQPASPRSMTHSSSLEPLGPLPSRRKRKPLRETRDGEVVLSGEMTTEEQILMQLTEQQNLPWKEVAARFKEQTGKAMKVPALQMRKKRLVERLRVWTPSEVKYPSSSPYSRRSRRSKLQRIPNISIGTGAGYGLGRLQPFQVGNHCQYYAQVRLL